MRTTRIDISKIYLIAVWLCLINCIDYNIYIQTNRFLFTIVAIVTIVNFIIVRKINIKGIGFLFATIGYFFVVNFLQSRSILLGFKYSCIFLSIYLFERVPIEKDFWKMGILFGLVFFLRYYINSSEMLRKFSDHLFTYSGVNNIQMMNVNIPCFMMFICYLFAEMYTKMGNIRFGKMIAFFMMMLSVLLSRALECNITILTSILLFFSLEIVPIKFWKNKTRMLSVFCAVFLVGCVFPFVIVSLPNLDVKVLSGRDKFWLNYMMLIRTDLKGAIFGFGTKYRLYVSASGLTMHNSYLEMAFNFGLIGVFLYWLFGFRAISSSFNKGMSDSQVYLFVAYIVLLIFAYANTAIQREYLFIFYSLLLGSINNPNLRDIQICPKAFHKN